MSAQEAWGREIPKPSKNPLPGKFVQRLPRTIHARLAARARQEGVSLNTLVLTFIAEGLGRKESPGG
jgi:antitoxin HicB